MESGQLSAPVAAIREIGVLSDQEVEKKEVGPAGAIRASACYRQSLAPRFSAIIVQALSGQLTFGRRKHGQGLLRSSFIGRVMTGNTGRRLLTISFALPALILPGCAQLAQPSEAPPSVEPQLAQPSGDPPSVQPPYTSLVSKSFASFKAVASYEDFQISGLRWVHSFKGWSWLACVRFTDQGHVRTYAIFIQNDAVVDGRYAVQTDACGSQTYTPFDVVTGTLGRPTIRSLPPIY